MDKNERYSKRCEALFMSSKRIQEAIENIPRLSTGAVRVLDLISNTESSLQDIIKAVETDGVLTARMLKIVNSPLYGLIEPVTTLNRAVPYLGQRMVACIVLEECMGEMLRKPLAGYGSDQGMLWKHDLRTAVASREVARLNPDCCHPDVAFTGGLLHDIGKVVMSQLLAEQDLDIVEKLNRDESQAFIDTEREFTEMNHAELGGELASRWELPEILKQVIRYHHLPSAAEEEQRPLVYAVHLGDMIAMLGGFGTGIDNLYYTLDKQYTDYLQLDEEQMEMVMLATDEEFSSLLAMMEH
jgi:putative nucleotidyltransferase with HDIG domain